ncbi:MAG: glycoside hydrolase family 127 protein [FCB group bacterium]|jgi:hypothetical protein|nr:glycoside hydrolase family 127 protein [FCB group bacterium]
MNRILFTLSTLTLLTVSAVAGPATTPDGELAARIDLIRQRILVGQVPALTPDFILADVALRPEYPRRFDEFSGDVSGRFIGALALLPLEGVRLDDIAHAAIKYQKPDGRFGDAALDFTAPDKIGFDHMALLWGNGRFLAGLLEYNIAKPDPAVVESARKLGDFLRAAYNGCANEQVAQRVKDLGANGMICFTQLIEGLVMLADATGDKAYLDTAESIIPWFDQDRGKQHSHGYFSTLRGILMLHEATGKPEHLALVENLYKSFVESGDLQPYGGVNEYFGGKGDRDEGCSEADFLRLSLQLWRVTGRADYLDRAEHIYFNQFSANQFPSGDFGHHAYTGFGITPVPGEGRAWWCCTWHGLRAYRDVLDSIVTEKDGAVRVNLFQDVNWSNGERALSVRWIDGPAGTTKLILQADKVPADGLRVAIRKPAWAAAPTSAVATHEENGYLVLDKPLADGERVELDLPLLSRIVERGGAIRTLDQLTAEPVAGLLFYGPWILGVSGFENTGFWGEPWSNNRVYVPATLADDASRVDQDAPGVDLPIPYPAPAIERRGAHLWLRYLHDGFPGACDVLLRPMAEAGMSETKPFIMWINYCKPAER